MLHVTGRKPLLLVFPFGLLSHYLRCLVLCRHLSPYFEIRIAYHKGFSSFIEKENMGNFLCDALDAPDAIKAVKHFDFSWINEIALEKIYLEQVRIIRKYQPIAVLGDQSPTLKMAAEKTSVRYISLLNGYMSKHYAGHRQISKTHPVYPFLKILPYEIKKILTEKGEARAFRRLHEPFKKIRHRHQLQTQYGYLDEIEGDINLICDLPDLFPQKDLPASFHTVAPLFYEPPVYTPGDSMRPDNDKKTILASMGSTGDWEKISFLNDPYYTKYNIVATGDRHRILSADHISHVSFANLHDLFPFIHLVICHGGNGTLYQSLLYQVPVLCKTSHCEQEWNVDALEKKGLGQSLDQIFKSADYKRSITEWLQKKGNYRLQLCSENIKRQREDLPRIIKQVADIILQTPLNKVFLHSVDSIDDLLS